jgi:hypothetical protein
MDRPAHHSAGPGVDNHTSLSVRWPKASVIGAAGHGGYLGIS